VQVQEYQVQQTKSASYHYLLVIIKMADGPRCKTTRLILRTCHRFRPIANSDHNHCRWCRLSTYNCASAL